MATPWSLKGSKDPPLLALDEFMILDSDDGDPATKNKRVTLATAQANLVTSVDAKNFNITKLNSISINDSANNNTFTISSSVDLAADRTINLPLVTADDTFAMLGVSNKFSEDNTFEKNILMVSDISCTSIFTTVAANNGLGGRLVGQFTRGTIASQLPILDNDRLYVLIAAGFDGTIFANAASLIWGADGNWTGANHGSTLTFTTTPTNTITPAANIIIKNKVISFEDNDIDNIKSIKLNDSDDTHSYIILGDDLSNDRNVTIPTIDADDTFALLGVQNDFTKRQLITLALSTIVDGLSIGNSDGNLVFGNNTETALQFAPLISLSSKGSSNPSTTQAVITAGDDTGTVPAYVINVTRTGGGDIVARNLWEIQNNGTAQVSVAFDGTWDFQGNTITNVVLQSTLSEGSIFVGDESNDSKDFPTGLEPKIDCRVATTTANIDLSSSVDPNPIDGVTLVNLDRILLKNQTDASENGIYVAVIATDPTNWVRSGDANNDSLVNNGMFTKITEGTLNGNTAFVLSTPDTPTIVLGTTSLLFNKFIFGDVPFLSQNNTFTASNNTFFDTITLVPNAFADALLDIFAFSDLPLVSPIIIGSRSRGSESSPTAVVDGDILFELSVQGHNGTDFVDCGTFNFQAAGTFTATPLNKPTKFTISTQPANSAVDPSPTRLVIGAEGETSFQDNIIQDIKSIKLNDASDNNTFTILGAELAGNFDVTIPIVIANDTFAMLGVSQTFTDAQTIAATTATDLTLTPPSAPTGSASDFTANLDASSGTIAFATTPQTGDFIGTNFAIQTLTNPMSGTITDAATLRIAGEPLASTNVTITNNAALHVVAGLSRFDGSMRIPASAAPSVTVDGDFAFDTTVTGFSTGLMKFFGNEEQGIVSMPISQFTSPTNGDIVTYNTTNTEFQLVAPTNIKNGSIASIAEGASVAVVFNTAFSGTPNVVVSFEGNVDYTTGEKGVTLSVFSISSTGFTVRYDGASVAVDPATNVQWIATDAGDP